MKQKKFLLVVVLAVILLLVAAIGCLMLYTPKAPANEPIENSRPVPLLVQDGLLPERIAITNSNGSYQITIKDSQATVAGYESLLNPQQVARVVSDTTALAGNVIDPAPQSLADFGLTSPQATVVVDYPTNSYTLLLGDAAPAGAGIYAMLQGEPTVYLLSYGWEGLLQGVLSLADRTVVEVTGDSGTVVPIAISLGGALRETPIELMLPEQSRNSTGFLAYQMTAPRERWVDSDDIMNSLLSVTAVHAEQVVDQADSIDKLGVYGLAVPYSTIRFAWQDATGAEQHCDLAASAPQDGLVYLLRDNAGLIYQVSTTALPWLELQYQDLVSSSPLTPFIFDVASVTIAAGSSSHRYEITPVGTTDITVTQDGKPVDSSRFKKLYQNLIALPNEQYVPKPPSPLPATVLSITYQYHDGRTPDSLLLLQGPALQCYLWVNGEIEFLTESRYADIIVKNIAALERGEALVPLY